MGTTDSRDVQAKIQLRRNAFSSESTEIKFKHNETIEELIKRSLLEAGYPEDSKLEEYFQVLKDGVVVDKELYSFLKVDENATYLIAPEIKGGSGGQLFKQIAILAIAVTASVLFPPSAGVWSGLAAAAITVGGTLLMNALIPPPAVAMGGVTSGDIEEQSQMYSITGQSNAIQRYGIVPRVYGRHRIYPKVAATPYISLELNDVTGEWEQYYHAVYDFGVGPSVVENIKIGDTHIEEFDGTSYNLVNPEGTRGYGIYPGRGWYERPDWSTTIRPQVVFIDDPNYPSPSFPTPHFAVSSGNTSNIHVPVHYVDLPLTISKDYAGVRAGVGDTLPEIAYPTTTVTGVTLYAHRPSKVIYEAVFDTSGTAWDPYVFVRWQERLVYSTLLEVTDRGELDEIPPAFEVQPLFNLYEGKVNSEGVGATLERNSEDTVRPAETEYTIVREVSTDLLAAYNADNTYGRRYLEVNFSFPRGLVAHNTAGSAGERNVYVDVQVGKRTGVDDKGNPVYGGWTRLTDPAAFKELVTSGSVVTDTVSVTLQIAPAYKVAGLGITSPNGTYISTHGNYKLHGLGLAFTGSGYLIPIIGNPALPSLAEGKLTVHAGTMTSTFTLTGPAYHSGIEDIYLLPVTGDVAGRFLWYCIEWHSWAIPSITSTLWITSYPNIPYPEYMQYEDRMLLRNGVIFNIYAASVAATGDVLRFTGSTTRPMFAGVKVECIHLAAKDFSYVHDIAFKIIRVRSTSTNTLQIMDALSVDSVIVRHNVEPITSLLSHTFLEVKIKSTNQLQGQIDNLTGVVQSYLPEYKEEGYWKHTASSNPAWVYADLLTGEINRKCVPFDKLEGSNLRAWAEFCDEVIPVPIGGGSKRFSANFILDFKATLQSVLNSVGSMAQASLNIVEGKYGVLVDRKKTTPVQVFTPRNSSNVLVARTYTDLPHAFKLKYVDQDTWDVREAVVYSQGYGVSNSTDFEEITAFGCTNYAQAWRYGRYLLAQAIYRQDTITIEVDYENLVCTRGDYVQIAQDVLCAGGVPARVLEVNTSTVGTTITRTIVLDDNVDFSSDNYGIVIRNTANIVTLPTTLLTPDTVQIQTEVGSDITINEGDLVVVGERGREVMDCIVKSISPMDDFKAQLTLVEKADEIHDYAENMAAMIPYTPDMNEATEIELTPVKITGLVGGDTVWGVEDMQYVYFIQDVSWDMPLIENWEHFEVYRKLNGEWELTGIVHTNSCSFKATPEEVANERYELRVLAVSPLGRKLALEDAAEVDGEVEINDAAPANVASLDLDMDEVSATLKWPAVPAIDIIGYVIRFTTELENPTWAAASHYAEVGNITELPVARQTGTYLIKAKALNLILSVDPAMAISDIPDGDIVVGDSFEISNYPWNSSEGVYTSVDILDEGLPEVRTTLAGTWVGSTWSVDAVEGSIVLEDGSINLDLPRPSLAPYEVELESLLDVREIPFSAANKMASWADLSDLLTLVHDTPPHVDCRVVTQVSIDGGVTWTTFTKDKFELGTFQLRHLLTTNDVEYAPVLLEGKVKVSYITYKKHYNEVILPASAVSFTHDDPFYGPVSPTVKVTIDSASEGDYYLITNATTAGFDIEIFDANDNPVSRAVDIVVIGY